MTVLESSLEETQGRRAPSRVRSSTSLPEISALPGLLGEFALDLRWKQGSLKTGQVFSHTWELGEQAEKGDLPETGGELGREEGSGRGGRAGAAPELRRPQAGVPGAGMSAPRELVCMVCPEHPAGSSVRTVPAWCWECSHIPHVVDDCHDVLGPPPLPLKSCLSLSCSKGRRRQKGTSSPSW